MVNLEITPLGDEQGLALVGELDLITAAGDWTRCDQIQLAGESLSDIPG